MLWSGIESNTLRQGWTSLFFLKLYAPLYTTSSKICILLSSKKIDIYNKKRSVPTQWSDWPDLFFREWFDYCCNYIYIYIHISATWLGNNQVSIKSTSRKSTAISSLSKNNMLIWIMPHDLFKPVYLRGAFIYFICLITSPYIALSFFMKGREENERMTA